MSISAPAPIIAKVAASMEVSMKSQGATGASHKFAIFGGEQRPHHHPGVMAGPIRILTSTALKTRDQSSWHFESQF